ncbi:Phosphate-selective porin O and P [Roseimaritima multifibrata]|uniref:Phosphate-selective porin O and P n=1 Tax=Roseimaritima multifibrata TaxID=1930274 RepID=A0A517MCP2_9BACT|nr:porin [Roseimaritima multifibrata]QDS92659.1 Phosphate-selective porin O and P [Roseimaritima multifibrata]
MLARLSNWNLALKCPWGHFQVRPLQGDFMRTQGTVRFALLALIVCVYHVFAIGQEFTEPPLTIEQLQVQLNEQAAQIKDLHRRLEESDGPFGLQPESLGSGCTPGMVDRVPLAADVPSEAECDTSEDAGKVKTLNFYADYDRGFVIRPFDAKKHPFELKVKGWIQFRHHGFARNADSWTDNSGVRRPIRNRNAFDIERARMTFSGHAIDPRLTYFLQLDGDTDDGHVVDFFDYWWAWQFTDAFQIQFGKRKVPAGRQWLLGARRTRLVDRPLAVDFFRPDRTVGIFGVGKFAQHGHYEVMIGNGYRTANLPNSETDNNFTYAATSYIDPAGAFGGQLVDFNQTPTSLWRLGHSFSFSPQRSTQNGSSLEEADFVRLSDGTRLTQPGALQAGVTVSEFDLWLYGIDVSWKRQGWSLTSEVFLRWLDNIEGNGPIANDNLFQNGFYVEGGKFLVKKMLDFNVRYSFVSGDYGKSNEYAAGFNYYPLAKPQLKLSFDVTQLDGSPNQNRASDILVGDTGTLFRTQVQAEF